MTVLQAGSSLGIGVAGVRVLPASSRTRYGSLTNRQFVETVYLNVLGRPGDAGGNANYWTGQLYWGQQDPRAR